MAFLASFLQYFIKFVVFVILAVAVCLPGKKWRMSKDAKSEANEKQILEEQIVKKYGVNELRRMYLEFFDE